ncbi:TPA: type II toxin-antitoxin system Phd/YefM family antitoxin, partial [Enterobacter roggenkampii]
GSKLKMCSMRGNTMEKVNIYDAKTNLSKIVQEVARTGEPVVIAKNGHALVKVIAYREEKPKRKLGFMLNKGSVSDSFLDNFDDMNADEIQDMFEGKYE